MTTFQTATSALHTTVRIHSTVQHGTRWYQVFKNGVQVLETKEWKLAKECALR